MPDEPTSKPGSDDRRDADVPASSAAVASAAEERAIAEFGEWLDRQLELLVARWQHFAPPNAAIASSRHNTNASHLSDSSVRKPK